MASNSVWKTVFHLENSGGKVTSGPYSCLVGVAAGTRRDVHTPSVNASLVTAISNNLLAILQDAGFAGASVPGGTIVIEQACHAQSPEVFT